MFLQNSYPNQKAVSYRQLYWMIKIFIFYNLQLMATFYIETDKDYYFAGETVNGNIFINVGTMIVGAHGVALKFTGYQCVKWVEATQLHRPNPHARRHPNQPPPYDPIAAIPKHQIVHTDNMDISDCESDENTDPDFRPKYIHTSSDRYFKMQYFETRNMFTRSKVMIHQCSGFAPGMYSFPFSFKTFEGWPASFNHYTPKKKGVIIYHMLSAVEPVTRDFRIVGGRQIILRQTRMLSSQTKDSLGNITSCCCMDKGTTTSKMSFEKDGYVPGDLVQMIIEVDNTNCQVNINTITISVTNHVTMRSQGRSTGDHYTIYRKSINGVPLGTALQGDKAIRESFQMPIKDELKPSCSGTLLSSQYQLSIKMNHDISCQCCSDIIGSSIPIIIFPIIPNYPKPQLFAQPSWQPQIMPMTNMQLTNTFAPNPMNMPGGYPM